MRDEMYGRAWTEHHEQFSRDVTRALNSLRLAAALVDLGRLDRPAHRAGRGVRDHGLLLQHHRLKGTEMNANPASGALRRLIDNIRVSLGVLHAIQFSAPWNPPPRNCG